MFLLYQIEKQPSYTDCLDTLKGGYQLYFFYTKFKCAAPLHARQSPNLSNQM